MFQTGNVGVLDSNLQPAFANRPGNRAFGTLPPNLFTGMVGVSKALALDSHLWPSCGALGTPLVHEVPSPDESLLFTWDVQYAQNGRFAVATHGGVGAPRQVTGTVRI